jgi:hypothetical protein
MKNLFLVPTDKPSRLGYLTKKGKEVFKDLRLFDKPMPNILDSENQQLYITSEEQIKKDDWVFVEGQLTPQKARGVLPNGDIECANGIDYVSRKTKKIILTTDQDLIADGVQAIDDEFLEWFVKNPNCEFVEVDKPISRGIPLLGYKIIIPQKESKQETLKEAAKKYATSTADNAPVRALSFIQGAKWQSERMYSEEDIARAFNEGMAYETMGNYIRGEEWVKTHKKEWFEQFKKK